MTIIRKVRIIRHAITQFQFHFHTFRLITYKKTHGRFESSESYKPNLENPQLARTQPKRAIYSRHRRRLPTNRHLLHTKPPYFAAKRAKKHDGMSHATKGNPFLRTTDRLYSVMMSQLKIHQ